MRTRKAFFVAELLFCGTFLGRGAANAQATDRIRTFDSLITVDRDRTIHVVERLEIVNDSGFFDSGVHRRLRIKPVSAERLKAGSFQSFGVKVDGRDAVLHVSEAGDLVDVEIAPQAGSSLRGSHLIELSYAAKHQFEIYDNFEDLNQNITGEWPVSIDKATVEAHFPDGLPREVGFSAETGASPGSDFHFDCVRTDLPSGVRFETTHALPPNNRLFFESRFPHSSYFVSNVERDGYRAVLQNHRFLIPGLVSLCGVVLFIAAGVFVWHRGPATLTPISTVLTNGSAPRRFWREVLKMYRLPIVMFVLAIVPGLNFTYSGHGGPSWLIAPLCFPWVIVRILVKIANGTEESRRWYKAFCKITIPSYIAISLPLSWAAVTSIQMSFGLPVSPWAFFAVMVSPGPWWYFT